ncbi:Zinc finger, RING-type domain and Zinc finger, RING/FYVE/PHD-type domain-containing protein [Strongyloides ratti]|uniref:Zinc finger, RING-type domain and Zinc finger, RING/FYVE/PHD-type domain-containing protein n=1 Tax=Strongyloides ratti TaxID=34506 RepID=A0A090MZ65_STRRB|nr:Zinc finger, RING-type domain and Zinc finger, RING/FYVE/PHD-type domain-containing protein [Strongyloides ratti]CEF68394.1 Zinc finger, RING-type domain and Zinc finger, RING/FYVE/PHD-type domain-containing protein [Strongyloides ratti]
MDINERSITCSVCLDIFYDPVTIECGHCFCEYCIQYTINLNDKCPICQKNVEYDPINNYSLNKYIIDKINNGSIDNLSIKKYKNKLVSRRYDLALLRQAMIALFEILKFTNYKFPIDQLKIIWKRMVDLDLKIPPPNETMLRAVEDILEMQKNNYIKLISHSGKILVVKA